ncbi:MAG: hypothetical protein QQN60_00945, partial [Nitrosopumilus sp.]
KFVMTSLIAKPIKASQIFHMIRLATKFAFYGILHSFFIFPRHDYDFSTRIMDLNVLKFRI